MSAPAVTADLFDLNSLKTQTAQTLYQAAKGLLEGAAGDLRKYAKEIAEDGISALTLPEPRQTELIQELKAQMRVIAEVNRIRANEAGWKTFEQVLMITLRMVVVTAVSLLPK